MALGYCENCRKLVQVRPVSLKLGSRECEWRPLPHGTCTGDQVDIRNHPEALPPLGGPTGPDAVEAVLLSDYEPEPPE